MNIEVVELIAKANQIISVTGNGAGTKYPKSLKKIVVSLVKDHNISAKEIIKHIPISSYSVREWPRQYINKKGFNKVIINEDQPKISKKKTITKAVRLKNTKMDLIILNQRILIMLITLLIFQFLAFHLFY